MHVNQKHCNRCLIFAKENKILREKIKQQQQIIQKQNNIIISCNNNYKNNDNDNNTSSSYPLPSEFKYQWECFAQNKLMDAFECSYDNPQIISFIMQNIMNIIYKNSFEYLVDIIKNILKCINVKYHSNTTASQLLIQFRNLLKEYYTNLIDDKNDKFNIQDCKRKISNIIQKKITKQKDKINALNDIETNSFTILCIELYKICIYMHLHQPQLTIKQDIQMVYLYYNRKHMHNIEGFGSEKMVCLIVLFPPFLGKNYSYQGIKPYVCIIPNPSEEMIQECEKNKTMYNYNGKGRSSSEENENIMQMYCNSNDINIQDNNVTFSNDINYRKAPYNNYSRNMSCGNLAKYSKRLKFYRGKNNLSNYDESKHDRSFIITQHNTSQNIKTLKFSKSFNSKNSDDDKLTPIVRMKKNFTISQKHQRKEMIEINDEDFFNKGNLNIEYVNPNINCGRNKKVISTKDNFSFLNVNYDKQNSKKSNYCKTTYMHNKHVHIKK